MDDEKLEMLFQVQEMMARATGDTRLEIKCRLDRLVKRVSDDISKDKKFCIRDYTAALNILDQFVQCYEDISNTEVDENE